MRYEIIPFGDHQLAAAEIDGRVKVLMKPMCETLTLGWEAQRQRIYRTKVLAEGACILQVPSASGMQDMVALDLEKLPGWLATISTGHIQDEAKRALIEDYQRRAYRVLYEYFFGPMVSRDARVSVTEMIQLQRERRRIAKELIRETHAIERACLYADLLRTNGRLGAETPAIEALGRTVISLADQAAPFFDLLAALDDKGLAWNHSRKPDKVWAVSMPELSRLAGEIGQTWRLSEKISFALQADPRFVAAKTVNSVKGGAVHCWVFEAPARH